MHTYIHTCIHRCIRTCVHTYIHLLHNTHDKQFGKTNILAMKCPHKKFTKQKNNKTQKQTQTHKQSETQNKNITKYTQHINNKHKEKNTHIKTP